MKLNGKLIRAGEYMQTDNPELFLQRGYARRLTRDEAQKILSEYVKCAEDLFSKVPEKAPDKKTVFGHKDRKAIYQERLL